MRGANFLPLVIASLEGYEDTVRALLGHPRIQLMPRPLGMSPLGAAIRGKATRIIELIARQEPAAIAVPDASELAPLHIAILLGPDDTWYNMLLDLLPDRGQLARLNSPWFTAICQREGKTNLLALTLGTDAQDSDNEEELE
jgi:hypothetical protein